VADLEKKILRFRDLIAVGAFKGHVQVEQIVKGRLLGIYNDFENDEKIFTFRGFGIEDGRITKTPILAQFYKTARIKVVDGLGDVNRIKVRNTDKQLTILRFYVRTPMIFHEDKNGELFLVGD
jgi:hypothetical protein